MYGHRYLHQQIIKQDIAYQQHNLRHAQGEITVSLFNDIFDAKYVIDTGLHILKSKDEHKHGEIPLRQSSPDTS